MCRSCFRAIGAAGRCAWLDGRGSLGPVVLQFNAPVYGVDDLEDTILQALEQAKRRGRV